MYRKQVQHPEFESFYLPFGGHLRSDNRWVGMAKRHARYVIFQMAEVAVSRELFAAILGRIRQLRILVESTG